MNTLEGIIEDVEKSDLLSDKVIKKVRELIGQEKWQELHDEESNIITTPGELLITLKGIEELEKENAELKKENENLASIAGHQQSSNMKRYIEIEELKRENAGLKAQIKKMKCCQNCSAKVCKEWELKE